jgi:hypothetical protein
MESLKLKQIEPLQAASLPKQRLRGLDYDEDGNVINTYSHEEVIERADRRMIAHDGEPSRRLVNERRARNNEKLL